MQFPIQIVALLGVLSISVAAATAWSGYGYAAGDYDHFFEQNTKGLYAYGYSAPHATKQEVRSEDGVTRGFYSYVDANNELQSVQYIADADGFHVAATNLPRAQTPAALPQPVTETPEVAAARAQHLAAHEAAKLRNSVPQLAASFDAFNEIQRSRSLLSGALATALPTHRSALQQIVAHKPKAAAAFQRSQSLA